jgi:hypothetical protein
MNWQRILIPVAGAALVAAAWRAYGWAGVALAASALLFWVLLNFTRLMHVLKQAAERPVGYVASAVMLNAKLKPGVNLMHVVAMTKALGKLRSPPDTQPETFRWTDTGGSHVTCEFRDGKLVKWELVRPPAAALEPPPGGPPAGS